MSSCLLLCYILSYLLDDVRKLREEYLNATEYEKKAMERKYGHQCIKQVLQDSFSEDWLLEHSKKCPSCGSHIQVLYLALYSLSDKTPDNM